MSTGNKVDLVMFGFILVLICVVSGLFSCLVGSIGAKKKRMAPVGPRPSIYKWAWLHYTHGSSSRTSTPTAFSTCYTDTTNETEHILY